MVAPPFEEIWMPAIDLTPLRNPRVLIIEDSPVICRLIEVCLRPIDAHVTMVSDGASGLQSAAVDRPDVVILDIGLPGMDGWEVLARLRESELTGDVPVMLLTGHADEYGSDDARANGAAAFMTKPFQPEHLRRQVMELLPDDGVRAATEVA
jgi:CheY-like chemotaxis protein